MPAASHFRGTIHGSPASTVAISVLEDGSVSGLATRGRAAWALGKSAGGGGGLRSTSVHPPDLAVQPFPGGNTGAQQPTEDPTPPGTARRLQQVRRAWAMAVHALHWVASPVPHMTGSGPRCMHSCLQAPDGQTFIATIALETDGEYLAMFKGNATDAANYAAALFLREWGGWLLCMLCVPWCLLAWCLPAFWPGRTRLPVQQACKVCMPPSFRARLPACMLA